MNVHSFVSGDVGSSPTTAPISWGLSSKGDSNAPFLHGGRVNVDKAPNAFVGDPDTEPRDHAVIHLPPTGFGGLSLRIQKYGAMA